MSKSYFASKSMEFTFYLTELDGELRMTKLKLYKIHYMFKEAGIKWYNTILDNLNTGDRHDNYDQAIEELNIIYKRLQECWNNKDDEE